MNHFSVSPSSSLLAGVNKMREIRTDSTVDSNHNELTNEMVKVQLFKVVQENKRLRLGLEHERKQRTSEQRMINQILQSITCSEMELGYQGRNRQTLGSVVSKLIKASCAPHLSSSTHVHALAKKIVTIYSNELKDVETRESHNPSCEMNPEPDSDDSPRRDVSRHISYSLFGDARLTSAALDAVEETTEEQLLDSSSESEDDFSSYSDQAVDEGESQEDGSESECVVIDDGSEIQNIMCFIIDQVVDDKETSAPVNDESGYLSPSEVSGTKGEKCEIATSAADAGVQTDTDHEKNELIAQVEDLKEAICQQSLQLLLSNEQIIQMQSAPLKQKQVEDDLQAFQELVDQQSALLKKVTLELEETKRKLNVEVACVSVQVPPPDQDSLSEAQSEIESFEEILIDLSEEGLSSPSDRTSNFMSASSLGSHSTVRSSTPNIESKVRDVTLKLRQLFQLR